MGLLLYTGFSILLSKGSNSLYGADLAPPDTIEAYYIELDGVLRDMGEECLYGVTIKVYKDSALYLTCKSKHTGKNSLKLPLDHQYTLVFSKPGYVSKKISINAQVPLSRRKDYKFLYSIYLFESIESFDICEIERPVAYVVFNGMNRFGYDQEYTSWINRDMEKQYKSYYTELANSKAKALKKVKKTF